MKVSYTLFAGVLTCLAAPVCIGQITRQSANSYPAGWFAPINDSNKPDWEILPQQKAGRGDLVEAE